MSRRSLFALLALVLLTSTAQAATDAKGIGPDQWTQYRLNAANNAVHDTGAEPLPRMALRTGDQVRATPVVIGDSLYVGNHLTGGMFRFDLASGERAWHDDNPWFRHAPNWIHSEMIQADGRIFVGYGNRVFQSATVRGSGASGVMAVNPENGETLWQHPTRGEVMPTPALWEGTLYAVTGGGELIALAPESGKQLWSLDLPGWVSMSSPAIADGILYVGALNSVVAVDLARRETLWSFFEDGTFTDVPPAVSKDGVVVITAMKGPGMQLEEEQRHHPARRGYFHYIYAFDGRTGELLWRDLLGSGAHQDNNTSGAPAIHDGRVYVGSPYTLSVFSYDVKTGKRHWEHPVGAKVKGAPAITDGKVVFGDTAGFLHLLEAETGQRPLCVGGPPVGKLKVGGSRGNSPNAALAPGGPVIVNRSVIVGSQDNFVHVVPLTELECR